MVTAMGEAAWEQLRARAEPLDDDALRHLSPLLVLAPHPDDETLGCGGLLAASSDLGLRPRVAFLTDGAASHLGSPSWPPERLAGERKSEALAALAVLGVGEQDGRFLEWPDGEPFRPGTAQYARTLETLTDWGAASRFRTVLAPWREESHGDHQAASHLADAVAERLGPAVGRLDYLVWGWNDASLVASVADHAVLGLDCQRYRDRRAQALACHRTQTTGLIDDAVEAFRVPDALAALTDRPTEIFLRAHDA